MRDTWTVFWRELLLLRKKYLGFLAGSMVSPILYLLSFGWGLGRNIQFGATSYLDFVVPGIIALSALSGSYNATGVSLNVSRLYYKTLEEFLVAPISVWSLALGTILAGCLRGLIPASIVLVGAFFFGAHLHTGFWFWISLLLTCFLFSSLGLVAAMIVNTHEEMARFSTFVIMPMTFLCGTFFRIDKYPRLLAALIQVLPLTHSSIALRSLALETGFPLVSLLVLVAYSAVLFGLGIWVTLRVE